MNDKNKHCRECKSVINEGATKCLKCGAHQDWRHYMTFSATILSLIIALISVSSVVIPIIINSLEDESSNIIVTPVYAEHRNIQRSEVRHLIGEGRPTKESIINTKEFESGIFFDLIATNSGTRAGAIYKIEIGLKCKGWAVDHSLWGTDNPESDQIETHWFPTDILGSERPQPKIVEPGSTINLTAFYHFQGYRSKRFNSNGCERNIMFRITEVNSEGQTLISILKNTIIVFGDLPNA